MLKFLFGVAFGAAGYWAWQSFGRDLFGMGGDQETTYGGFSSSAPATSTPSTGFGPSATTGGGDFGAASTTSGTPGNSTGA